jgi:hypothetical protein
LGGDVGGFEHSYTQAAELYAGGAATPDGLRTLAYEYGYEIFPPVPTSAQLGDRNAAGTGWAFVPISVDTAAPTP